MPIYEFECKSCNRRFEKIVFKPIKEIEIICPNCQSKNVQKVISAPGAIGKEKRGKKDYSYPSCSSCCGGSCPTNFD